MHVYNPGHKGFMAILRWDDGDSTLDILSNLRLRWVGIDLYGDLVINMGS